jgi:hypothetical protein
MWLSPVYPPFRKKTKDIFTNGKKTCGSFDKCREGTAHTYSLLREYSWTSCSPASIFLRKGWKNELNDNAPPGTLGIAHETGWMTGEFFFLSFSFPVTEAFLSFVKSSQEHKVLLIVDEHSSHKHGDVLSFEKENGIVMFFVPPQCFRVVEGKSWKNCYTVPDQFTFSTANEKAATIAIAQSGFRINVIWPFNADIFEDFLLDPAETTKPK